MKVATCEIILFWCIKIIQYKLVPSFTKCLPIILKFTHLGEHTLSNQEDPCYFLADKEIYKSINTRVKLHFEWDSLSSNGKYAKMTSSFKMGGNKPEF